MKSSAIALGLAISIPLANAYTGDLTHYTPVDADSCGGQIQNGDAIVALSTDIMGTYTGSNPNNNPLCGKKISIHNPIDGTNTIATVSDTCGGCATWSIDVMADLFVTIAPTGDGRVHGIEWTPVDWTMPASLGGSASAPAQSVGSSAVQPTSSAAAAIPSVAVQQEVVAVVPSPAAAAPTDSSSTPAAPSAAPAPSASVSSAPPASAGLCTAAGEAVCSADGTQIGTCALDLTVELGPVALGTKCVNGYMVMANTRLRSRRG